MLLRILILPFISLVALVSLLIPIPARPAAIASHRLACRAEAGGRAIIISARAKQLLHKLADGPAEQQRVHAANARPALRTLNRTAVPHLALCPAPACDEHIDLLILTLLHKRSPRGPAHDPHRGVVEQWVRPAAHYLRASPPPPAAVSIAHAARRGGVALALKQLAEQARVALHPQLLSDPDDWRLLWRQQLPGPAELISTSNDGRRLAVSYRRLRNEAATVHLRQYTQPRGEPEGPSSLPTNTGSSSEMEDDDDDDDSTGGSVRYDEIPPSYDYMAAYRAIRGPNVGW